jgi:signal transduction histidine kinase
MIAISEREAILELERAVRRFNNAYSSFTFGVILRTEEADPTLLHPPGFEPQVALAIKGLEETRDDPNPSIEIDLSLQEDQRQTLFVYRLNVPNPRQGAPQAAAWCIGRPRERAQEFFPLPFRDFAAWCIAYLLAAYSRTDPYFLIARAFQVGSAQLGLSLLCNLASADAAILWIYRPKPKVFETVQVMGMSHGRHHLGLGKGIVGQLSPTRSQILYDKREPKGLKPYHPDLFKTENWERCQAAAVRSRGLLLGALSLYWNESNPSSYMSRIDAYRVSDLAYGFLITEWAQMHVMEAEDTYEKVIRRLTPAQALIPFLHDVQKSLREATTAMASAAVILGSSQRGANLGLTQQLTSAAAFVDNCMNRMGRLALLQERRSGRRRVDLRRLLVDNRSLIELHGTVKIEVIPGSRPVLVQADRLELERAVLNLVSNAVYWTEMKAMGERRVTVSLRTNQEDAIIDVEDTGVGIGPAVRDTLFERFVTGRPDSGTGMGLFLTRESMQKNGGAVEFTDRHGGGAIFRLRLPHLREPE